MPKIVIFPRFSMNLFGHFLQVLSTPEIATITLAIPDVRAPLGEAETRELWRMGRTQWTCEMEGETILPVR